MPTPSFPSTLPLVSRFTVTPNDGVLADEDDGVKEFRLRSLDRGAKGSAEWTFIQSDLQIFDTFCKTTLLNGHRQFCLELPSAAGIACHIVRMLNRQIRPIGHGAYTVTCDLEIRSRAFDPCDCPDTGGGGGGGTEIGWLDPVYEEFGEVNGIAAHTNSGSSSFGPFGSYPGGNRLYAGVVGWTDETVVWSSTFAATEGGRPPELTPIDGGRVRVSWYNTSNPGFDDIPIIFDPSKGLLTLTATINGTPIALGQRIVAVMGTVDFYPNVAWGPET